MEANIVTPSQLPLRPSGAVSKSKAKPKPKSRQLVHRDESVASSAMGTGGMSDATKRLAPDDGFGLTMDDLPDDVACELFELLHDGFSVVEEPLVRELWLQPPMEAPPQPTGMGYLNYDDVDERIELPVGVESTRSWGATEIQMPKFRGIHTFETLVKAAIGGDKEAVKYCAFIKMKYLKAYTTRPASQGPDLAGFLQRVWWEPPVAGYVRTQRTGWWWLLWMNGWISIASWVFNGGCAIDFW